MFELILSPEAADFYREADLPLAKKLARCFSQLERDPFRHNNVKKLTGKLSGRFRYRVGDWRVVYTSDASRRVVAVLVIAHRSEVYE